MVATRVKSKPASSKKTWSPGHSNASFSNRACQKEKQTKVQAEKEACETKRQEIAGLQAQLAELCFGVDTLETQLATIDAKLADKTDTLARVTAARAAEAKGSTEQQGHGTLPPAVGASLEVCLTQVLEALRNHDQLEAPIQHMLQQFVTLLDACRTTCPQPVQQCTLHDFFRAPKLATAS